MMSIRSKQETQARLMAEGLSRAAWRARATQYDPTVVYDGEAVMWGSLPATEFCQTGYYSLTRECGCLMWTNSPLYPFETLACDACQGYEWQNDDGSYRKLCGCEQSKLLTWHTPTTEEQAVYDTVPYAYARRYEASAWGYRYCSPAHRAEWVRWAVADARRRAEWHNDQARRRATHD